MTSLRFLTFTFWNFYVLKLLSWETLTFSYVTLIDINVVWCYVMSQYQKNRYTPFTITINMRSWPKSPLNRLGQQHDDLPFCVWLCIKSSRNLFFSTWSRIHDRTISLRFLESFQTWSFRVQCLHYKTVPNHFCSRGGGWKGGGRGKEGGVKSVSRGGCE